MIQKQLSDLVLEWNHHRIRNTLTAEAPGGIPEVLYHLPAVGSSGIKYYYELLLLYISVVQARLSQLVGEKIHVFMYYASIPQVQ